MSGPPSEDPRADVDPSAGTAPDAAEIERAYSDVLENFATLLNVTDTFEVEVGTSEMLGFPARARHDLPEAGQEVESAIVEGLLQYAGSQETPEALAMLRALAAMATIEGHREQATALATRLAALGVEEPSWGAQLDVLQVGESLWLRDVLGHQAQLMCTFRRNGVEHGILLLLQLENDMPRLSDAWATDQPEMARAEFRKAHKANPDNTVLETLTSNRAHSLLEEALRETDNATDPDIEESYFDGRALVMARCRALAEAGHDR